MDDRVEAPLAPARGRLARARTLGEGGDEARREQAIPMACGITAAIEVEGGASQVRPDLLGPRLHGFEPLRQQDQVYRMDGGNRGGCDDTAMLVCDRDPLRPCLRLVARLAHATAPWVATVVVPSPWSTLISRCFTAARWATRAIHACPSDPSAARVVQTVETVVSWLAGWPRAAVGTAKHGHGVPVKRRPHTNEVNDASRVQCARQTSLAHREVREDIDLELEDGAVDRPRRRGRLRGGDPPEAWASPKACGRERAHQRASEMTRGADG